MKKKFKKILFFILGISSVSAFSIPLLASCVSQSKIINNSRTQSFYYKYDNQLFQHINELVTYYISQNPGVITNDYYLGNIPNAILDPSSQLVNVNQLKKYDPKKMFPVYIDGLGNKTHDYNLAKKSYVNYGLIQYKYYDFNGQLFSSENEAKDSIISSKTPTGVMYYKNLPISPNQYINFNPLSVKDNISFKEIAFNEIIKKIKDEKYFSYFDFKIYDKDYNGMYSSKNSSKWIDENLVHNMIIESLNTYFKVKHDLLKNDIRFNVELKLIGNPDYNFTGFNSNNPNVQLVTNKSILFQKISFNDLLKFNSFINRKDFFKNFHTWIKFWARNYLCEEAKFIDFLGANFFVTYAGDSWGSEPGTDFKILSKGTHARDYNSYVAFDLNIKTEAKNGNLKEIMRTQLNNSFLQNSENNGSVYHKLKKIIFDQVSDNLLRNEDFNIPKISPYNYNDAEATSNDISNLQNLSPTINKFLENGSFSDENCLKIGNDQNNVGVLKGIDYGPKLLDINLLNNKFEELWNNELMFNIEYKNNPIFSTPISEFLKYNENNFSFNSKTGYSSNIAKNLNELNNTSDKEHIKKLKNISQQSINNKDFNYINPNNHIFSLIGDSLKFNYDNPNISLTPTTEIVPEIQYGKETNYEINSLVKQYNKLINLLKTNNPNNAQTIIQTQITKPEDIVVLKNANSLPTMIYNEFLSNSNNVSGSLINKSLPLFNDKHKLLEAIKTTTHTKPAKVVVIYDFYNNVINPGVVLSEQEELLTTSDAIFDSENTIIENILRTKLVPKLTNQTYYIDGNNPPILLDKQLTNIYKLNINDKNYYYPTHSALINELKNYLESISQKVVF